jgi:hypothetical protein
MADAGVRDRFDERYPRRLLAALNIGMAVLLTLSSPTAPDAGRTTPARWSR